MSLANQFDAVREIESLRLVVEGAAGRTGVDHFQHLVECLAKAMGTPYALVSEFADSDSRVRTIAFWAKGRLVDNVEYDLAGTPCLDVVNGGICFHPDNVAQKFPGDAELVRMNLRSYFGVPLVNESNQILGHLAVFDERAMPDDPRLEYIFRIFGARAAAELVRMRLMEQLEKSEKQYRDLFDQAPIPYVYEDTDTRFISVNSAAMKLLGLKPEDVPGTVGRTLVANSESNLEQLNRAFEDIKAGRERGLIELELRRKDNGQPIWVQFWSRPEPDGKHTRTMIIDTTQRVLAERDKARLQSQNTYLQEELQEALQFAEIVGRSPSLAAVLENVRAVAPTDASVLITGETGTGKELIARAIHMNSQRKDKPMIKVNCAALPASLIESELFGHEKGAFTGATNRRAGRFELADGGTIFLDEIGDLPVEMQAKLLRVLQERELERIGGTTPVPINVRILAATNRDLAVAIAENRFREDLYYRLNVFPIALPALRDRTGDIPLLANYFVRYYAKQFGKPIAGIAPDTMNRLLDYKWPGNIRELQNIIERAAILTQGSSLVIGPDVLVGSGKSKSASGASPSATSVTHVASAPAAHARSSNNPVSLVEVEREHIRAVLEQTGWRIDGPRGAAAILDINPNTLRSRMKKLGIARP